MTVAARDPEVRFEVTTHDDPEQVRIAISDGSEFKNTYMLTPARPIKCRIFYSNKWRRRLRKGKASELGRSPTRMGEKLGYGLQVVADEGIGDVAHIIRHSCVGVLVAGPDERDMEAACTELQDLLCDPELSTRCRHAAEEVFALKNDTAAYASLYGAILGDADTSGQQEVA